MRLNARDPALLPLVSTAGNDLVKWYVGQSAVVLDFRGVLEKKNARKAAELNAQWTSTKFVPWLVTDYS